MSCLCRAAVVAAVVWAGALTPGLAAPPTVVPSPGYDARLQESRKAMAIHPTVLDPAAPSAPVVPRHHGRPKR